jgi:hypothetical protein
MRAFLRRRRPKRDLKREAALRPCVLSGQPYGFWSTGVHTTQASEPSYMSTHSSVALPKLRLLSKMSLLSGRISAGRTRSAYPCSTQGMSRTGTANGLLPQILGAPLSLQAPLQTIKELKMRKFLCRLLPMAMMAALALTTPQAAFAEKPAVGYPACPGFNVTIESSGGTQDIRMTRVKDGIIYTIIAGRGTTITVAKVGSGDSVTFGTKGSVTRTAQDATTGAIDFSLSGANLVLLFDEIDVGGPSTVLYTGVVRFTTDSSFTLLEPMEQVSGTQRDICAELS